MLGKWEVSLHGIPIALSIAEVSSRRVNWNQTTYEAQQQQQQVQLREAGPPSQRLVSDAVRMLITNTPINEASRSVCEVVRTVASL